ncbi:MAG: glycogen synthase [Patescibacteria group bacterium]|nr:glycogen synthase [Patescibacteria group bacterium]
MDKKIKVLMVGYEADPFYKHGGLGDVIGSLPKALSGLNVDCRVVIPYYQAIKEKFISNVFNLKEERIGEFLIHFGEKDEQIGIYKSVLPGSNVIIYFLSNRKNLSYINTRGRNKKIDQFAFFDLAVSHFILWLRSKSKWTPAIVHCNDWHTSLIPFILQKQINTPIPTLLTIHNFEYQGRGSIKVLDLLHIKDKDVVEFKKGTPVTEINILGEGIMDATRVSTVSPNYAKEIINNSNCHGQIYSYMRRREREKGKSNFLSGILNGIDYNIWDSKNDGLIYHRYDISDWQLGKKINKEDLLKSLNLKDRPTFCFIGRMAKQKGIDLLVRAINRIVNLDVNLIFLGDGDSNIKKSLFKAQEKYKDNIRTEFFYSEELAHKLYASSDFILIPSHFEPCGLIQMIAMRYGTLPVASKTGGLKDSIKNNSTGFLFEKNSTRSLVKTIRKALRVYKWNEKYQKMTERAMKTDFSWRKSAKKYKKLYFEILKEESI